MVRTSRRRFLAAAGASALAGCFGGPDRTPSGSETGSSPSGVAASGTAPTDPTAAATSTRGQSGATSTDRRSGTTPSAPDDWPPIAEATLPLSRSPGAFRGAVVDVTGRDDIPSIEEPPFVGPDAAGEFLDPDDVVFGLERGGVAKAYPRSIMVWHEICNDWIAGEPVTVTYCPLTGTALGFERGGVRFGVSGRLLNNNLVMYDRATETWWPQMLGTSIPGAWNPNPETASLREFRVVWTTWERWRDVHPETAVLSRNTGYVRNYGDSDPYNGSYTPTRGYYGAGGPFYAALGDDDRFSPKTVVLGARAPEGAVAFQKDALRDATLMEGSLGERPVLAVYDPRYDTGYVYRNPDGADYEFVDGELAGPDGTHAPDALPLERVHTYDAMWFAWIGFYPESNVHA